MLRPEGEGPNAVIFGCTGPALTPAEAAFFRTADPLGFILFARNCETPEQIKALISALRAAVGRADAPVLIDQEGGSVRRLRPPQWDDVPAAAAYGDLYRRDPARGRAAAALGGRLIAAQLAPLGISVTCAPVLDVSFPDTAAVIGDRAFADDPAVVADLARAFCDGLQAGGVLPVIKHMPGHGRATVDSHVEAPRVRAAAAELRRVDFAPFRALADAAMGMTAHVVYDAFDRDHVATLSRTVIGDVIRGDIGFDGLLMTDDICMGALGGDWGARCAAALDAGCDVILHCSGEAEEMAAVAAAVPALSAAARARWQRAAARQRPAAAPVVATDLAEELNDLIRDA